jgi:hypothetical protein
MGFWSSVGGFFSSVASGIGSAVSSAWSAAKAVAGKAIGWMAEKAEAFIGGVKNVWQAVKPYVAQIRKSLLMAAEAVPIPWVKAALIGLEKGLGALTAFENSPIAKKIDDAIKWSIELAKRWQRSETAKAEVDDHLSAEELNAAKRHQETLRFAEREVVSAEERHHLELASAINDYEIARSDLANAIDSSPENFEHYLRLRATQKLLNMTDKKFRSAQSVDDLSADDLFIVRIASDLVKANPELSSEAAARLDRVLTEKYGTKLTPFVFEEMIASWGARAKELGAQWDEANRRYAKDAMLLKRLILARDIQDELSAEESSQLERLAEEVPNAKQQLDALATKKRDIERYVGAAEGFLQLLEKTEEEIEREDRSYLLEDGAAVGKLLIDCAQHELPFDMLTYEQQSLITDYANVFAREARSRMEKVLEMAA